MDALLLYPWWSNVAGPLVELERVAERRCDVRSFSGGATADAGTESP